MLASMLSIVYYRLQNAILFLWENIRSWCDICVCLQRELVLQSKGLVQVRPVQEHIRRPESPVSIQYWVAHDLYSSRPTWQFFSLTTLLFETHLPVLPLTLPAGTSPVQWHESSFMNTITFLTVVRDSKTSVTSATLALIWPSHVDLSLVPPKMWFDVTIRLSNWGDQLKMNRFWRSLPEWPEFLDSQECTNN